MLRYIVKRTLLAIPTLLLISMTVFGLSKCSPRDTTLDSGDAAPLGNSGQVQESSIRIRAALEGLDKPVFYFDVSPASYPDTAYRIFPYSRRARLLNLCAQSGDWPAVSRYESALISIWGVASSLPDTLHHAGTFRLAVSDMVKCRHIALLPAMFDSIQVSLRQLPANVYPAGLLTNLEAQIRTLRQSDGAWKMYRPAFHWYGTDNQYHHWIAGFVTGDLGLSRLTQIPVWESLMFALLSTLVINGLAICIAYLIAIPLGVAMARRRNRAFDKLTGWTLLLLYATPAFWMGGLLILLFATPDWGLFWIKGIAIESWKGSGLTFGAWCRHNAGKFILPIGTLSLHALAILALQMRGGMLENIRQDYIRTARAKGVPENSVYWRHTFRNALFPVITIFAGLFPAVFAGSLVVESLFQFPGIGMKTQEAFLSADYPVLFAILMMAAALTIVGSLIADLLYAWADPRVRFDKQ